jgi:hypothetical protein
VLCQRSVMACLHRTKLIAHLHRNCYCLNLTSALRPQKYASTAQGRFCPDVAFWQALGIGAAHGSELEADDLIAW